MVATGGALASVLVGAGIATLLGVSSNISAQGGFLNANPWETASVGGVSSLVGGFAGLVSFGFGGIGQSIGSDMGYVFTNMTHLSTGIKLGTIFGLSALSTAGSIVGQVIGGIVGGLVANRLANKLMGIDESIDKTVKNEIIGDIFSWLVEIFRLTVSKS